MNLLRRKRRKASKRYSDRIRSKEEFRASLKFEREDAAVEEYMRNAKAVGGFAFSCSAIVLHPETARTHFHLIYLTRDRKGVEVFKEAEKKAMEVQESARADAQQRRRVARQGQSELFASQEMHDARHYEMLRERYLTKARGLMLDALQSKRRVLYDDLWTLALSHALSWESDLKSWLADLRAEGKIAFEGMRPAQRVPHRDQENYIVWSDPRSDSQS